jgi:hypothetical protein
VLLSEVRPIATGLLASYMPPKAGAGLTLTEAVRFRLPVA